MKAAAPSYRRRAERPAYLPPKSRSTFREIAEELADAGMSPGSRARRSAPPLRQPHFPGRAQPRRMGVSADREPAGRSPLHVPLFAPEPTLRRRGRAAAGARDRREYRDLHRGGGRADSAHSRIRSPTAWCICSNSISRRDPHPHEASYPDFLEWSTAKQSFSRRGRILAGRQLSRWVAAIRSRSRLRSPRPTRVFSRCSAWNRRSAGRSFPPKGRPGAESRRPVQQQPVAAALPRRSSDRRPHHHPEPAAGAGGGCTAGRLSVRPGGYARTSGWPASLLPHSGSADIWHWLQVVARLRPGVTLPQARRELAAIAQRIAKAIPTTTAVRP